MIKSSAFRHRIVYQTTFYFHLAYDHFSAPDLAVEVFTPIFEGIQHWSRRKTAKRDSVVSCYFVSISTPLPSNTKYLTLLDFNQTQIYMLEIRRVWPEISNRRRACCYDSIEKIERWTQTTYLAINWHPLTRPEEEDEFPCCSRHGTISSWSIHREKQ